MDNKDYFKELYDIIKRLRDPETGCPWDKKQTAISLVPNFIEEVYEAVETIENNDKKGLCEELGDIFLHILFQIQIAEDNQDFMLNDVLKRICDKLVTRHPHIFGNTKADTEDKVKENWEKIKLQEKKDDSKSVLDGVPANMPALIQAQRIGEKASNIGFDWDTYYPVIDKIYEEIEEIKKEIIDIEKNIKLPENDALKNEIGDLLFASVNLSRKLGIDAETALRMANKKFKKRFKIVEEIANQRKMDMKKETIEVLDEIWNIAKNKRD
jgi:MazG family protein